MAPASPVPGPYPLQDLIVPLMKAPDHYHLSPLSGAPPRNRTWLAFHRGRVRSVARVHACMHATNAVAPATRQPPLLSL